MTNQSPRHALAGLALMALGVVGTAGAGSPSEQRRRDRALTARTGVRVSASYAASSVLAKQIQAGAPADAFFSADLAWVDYLEERGSSAARVARCSATRWCASPRLTAETARQIFTRYGFAALPARQGGMN